MGLRSTLENALRRLQADLPNDATALLIAVQQLRDAVKDATVTYMYPQAFGVSCPRVGLPPTSVMSFDWRLTPPYFCCKQQACGLC